MSLILNYRTTLENKAYALIFNFYYLLEVGMGVQVYHSAALKVIRELLGVSSFILVCVFQGSSPGHQAWWRTLFTDHCILYEIFPCRILKNLTNVCSNSVLLGLWNYFLHITTNSSTN